MPGEIIPFRERFYPHVGGVEHARLVEIEDKARQAFAANQTYLALGSPTAAQNTAQVKRLTRQVNALLRLTLGEFSDASDT